MSTITLVGTTHREHGLCNKDSLKETLLRYSPDVIFEELPAYDSSSEICELSHHTLEGQAIEEYLSERPAMRVAVDSYEFNPEFHASIDRLFDYVESNSYEYLAASSRVSRMSWEYGFSFLNSQEFIELAAHKQAIFNQIINMSGNSQLIRGLSEWNRSLRERESAMVENIYSFCRESNFQKGLFMIGAEHLPFISKKVFDQTRREHNDITWNMWSRA